MPGKQTIYGIYLAYIDEYLHELGFDSRAIFREAGVDNVEALQQGERITIDVMAAVMQCASRHVRRRSFYLELGARIPVLAHGALGSALMACKDVRTVMTIMERYAALVLPSVRITLQQDKHFVYVEYQISTGWPEVNLALIDAFIGTTSFNVSVMTGQAFYPVRVTLTAKAPPDPSIYFPYTHCDVEFNSDQNRMVFSQAQFDLPIKTANALNQRVMVKLCEDELVKVQSHTSLTERIREIISLYLEESPSIGFVADKLRISERTLRRRLNEEGINFRDLLKDIRHESAEYYLSKTDMRIENIAFRLGYKETANFRKAFKEKTGQSPRQWRDAQSGHPMADNRDSA
ncbi:MAG TPA: AraC family transcriptional regulator ligand-binding domain-containing protein [Pseudomonadales bacterium]|nr:AraC family transcriptional regulator ligand-binding domain-containing protein [Pseudomonadales bacterium]